MLAVSLRLRRNLTSVSNVCEATDILVLSCQRTQRITGSAVEFPFNLIGKSTMAFLTGQSWRIPKSWYTGGAQNKDFGAVSQTDLTRV